MFVDVSAVYKSTIEHFKQAQKNIAIEKRMFEHSADAISDVIPGFEADKLEFGSYDKENYAVLFVDMRRSTQRAQQVGPEKTFLTMHVFLTALLEVVKHYHGKVIDIMGDGLMVFWGGQAAREENNMVKTFAVQNAGLCGRDMLTVRENVINRIVQDENLGPAISIGVGVTFDSVIVTKIGIADSYDVKAFGDFYLDVLGSGHCKSAYAVEMGQDFWEENLKELILAGAKIGKDEHTVKQEISYAMVSIYQSLGKYDKAYDFVVEQAAGHPWLHLFTVQDIVSKVGYCDRLKTALYRRLGDNTLSIKQREDFTRIKDWLVFEYEK